MGRGFEPHPRSQVKILLVSVSLEYTSLVSKIKTYDAIYLKDKTLSKIELSDEIVKIFPGNSIEEAIELPIFDTELKGGYACVRLKKWYGCL